MLRLHIADKNDTISAMGATRAKIDGELASALRELDRISRLKQTTTVENMAKVAAADPDSFKTLLSAYMAAATDLKKAREEVWRQQDCIDLMRDELSRISVLCSNNPEISGLCERAITRTTQTIPVLEQRDRALEEIERLKRERDALKVGMVAMRQRIATLHDLDPISSAEIDEARDILFVEQKRARRAESALADAERRIERLKFRADKMAFGKGAEAINAMIEYRAEFKEEK